MVDLQQQAQALFGITLSDAQVAQFDTLAQELADWNTRMNLTAITEPQAVRVRHFLDSLSLARVLPPDLDGLRLIDVGTGAGFPGLPLALIYPQLQVTLLDATQKKLRFSEHIAQTLGLRNVQTLHARAEAAGHDAAHRAQYDVVVARAVARLPALLEYLLPLARVGGLCVAMKGSNATQEANDAKRALFVLGGDVERLEALQLPDVDEPHYLVCVRKQHKTPKQYPRKAGIPTRQPIGTPET